MADLGSSEIVGSVFQGAWSSTWPGGVRLDVTAGLLIHAGSLYFLGTADGTYEFRRWDSGSNWTSLSLPDPYTTNVAPASGSSGIYGVSGSTLLYFDGSSWTTEADALPSSGVLFYNYWHSGHAVYKINSLNDVEVVCGMLHHSTVSYFGKTVEGGVDHLYFRHNNNLWRLNVSTGWYCVYETGDAPPWGYTHAIGFTHNNTEITGTGGSLGFSYTTTTREWQRKIMIPCQYDTRPSHITSHFAYSGGYAFLLHNSFFAGQYARTCLCKITPDGLGRLQLPNLITSGQWNFECDPVYTGIPPEVIKLRHPDLCWEAPVSSHCDDLRVCSWAGYDSFDTCEECSANVLFYYWRYIWDHGARQLSLIGTGFCGQLGDWVLDEDESYLGAVYVFYKTTATSDPPPPPDYPFPQAYALWDTECTSGGSWSAPEIRYMELWPEGPLGEWECNPWQSTTWCEMWLKEEDGPPDVPGYPCPT